MHLGKNWVSFSAYCFGGESPGVHLPGLPGECMSSDMPLEWVGWISSPFWGWVNLPHNSGCSMRKPTVEFIHECCCLQFYQKCYHLPLTSFFLNQFGTGVRRGKTGIRKTNLEPVSIVTHEAKRTWTKGIQKRKKWIHSVISNHSYSL